MRYFFDIFDDDHWTRDDIGVDCRDERHARHQAVMTLTEMAREQMPANGDEMGLRILVRQPDGTNVMLKLDFDTERDPPQLDHVHGNTLRSHKGAAPINLWRLLGLKV